MREMVQFPWKYNGNEEKTDVQCQYANFCIQLIDLVDGLATLKSHIHFGFY